MKRLAGSILRHFIYSNLFIAGCAILMVLQTCIFLVKADTPTDLLGFVFFSTICSYSFHWYLTPGSVIASPRIDWLRKYRLVHTIFFFAGLAGAIFFFFRLSAWWPWMIIPAVMAFLYSAPKIPHPWFRLLREVALGKTIFLAFVWMYVTTVLPVAVTGGKMDTAFYLFVIHRFFYIYAICVLFDYRDRTDDKASGVKSLITYLGEKSITVIFMFSLLTGTIAAVLLNRYGYDWTNIFLLILPGLITLSLYSYARRNFSDILYYLVLDGLMALSAILMLVARI
jgi:4-hydroxybenzoate polyprenyltransferase